MQLRFVAAVTVASVLAVLAKGPIANAQPTGSYQQSCQDISIADDQLKATCKNGRGDEVAALLQNASKCAGDIGNDDGTLRCTRPPDAAGGPPGTYQQTCDDIHHIGQTLFARCRKNNSYVGSSLADTQGCVGDLWNQNGSLGCNRSDRLPPGSYKGTCRFVTLVGGTLSAECKGRDGSWVASTLSGLDACSQIANIDGHLTCARGDAPAPRGNYQQTCIEVVVQGGLLEARCKDYRGEWRTTSLRFGDCVGGVTNLDGFLTCPKGSSPPPGSYQTTCKDILTTGNTINADCRRMNGGFTSTTLDFSNCAPNTIYNSNGSLLCMPKDGGSQGGYSSAVVYNCHTDRRTIFVWSIVAGDTWSGGEALEHGWDTGGFGYCPRNDAPSRTIQLKPGKVYGIAGVDPGLIGCGGNQPNDICNKAAWEVRGGPASAPAVILVVP